MATPKPWDVHFFQRHQDDDPSETVPARNFLDACSAHVAARLMAVVDSVAAAPPPQFAGGGMWEAMHDEMKDVYEVRVKGPGKRLYRLFCVLENPGTNAGLAGPSVILIDGRWKPIDTALSKADYRAVKALVDEYRNRQSRSVET